MGKKMLGKKGYKLEENKMEEANTSKEVGDCDNVLPTSAEEVGVKFSNGDKKKKRRHDVNRSGNDVECSANALPTCAEEDVAKLRDRDKKKKKKKRHGVDGDDVEVGASQSEKEENAKMNNGEDGDLKKEKKKKKKRKRDKEGGDVVVMNNIIDGKEVGKEGDLKKEEKKKKRKRDKEGSDVVVMNSIIDGKEVGEEGGLKKEEKKKRKRDKEGGDVVVMNSIIDEKEVAKEKEQLDGKNLENVGDSRKKRKRDKKKRSNELEAVLQEMNDSSGIVDKEFLDNEVNVHLPRNEAGGRKVDVSAVNVGDGIKDKKKEKKKKKKEEKEKKVKSLKEGSEGKGHKGVPRTADPSENTTYKGRSKKVSFSDQVEVFPSSDGPTDAKNVKEDGLVHGKRFSREEDEKIKQAVANYIEDRMLGEAGLDMVMKCKSHPEIKHCWKEIGAALPWRPSQSIYYRAHIIFERSKVLPYTPDELKFIKDHVAKNGPDWKSAADVLGKHRIHVKDAWRRHKLANMKRGHWSQDEYQNLFDLVNLDLRMKAFEEKKSKHGMLRDNICWGAISDKLETRRNTACCMKWYDQLQSPMVAEGIWADVDDYHLLNELYNLDASCIEDVDWDYLLEHRSGDVCRKRWNQMERHIGDNGTKSFAEQVEVLSKRYCVDVIEAREAYDSKPAVP